MDNLEITARGSGYYKVFVNEIQVSKHTTEREAVERCVEILTLDPTKKVHYTHDYIVDVTISGVPIEQLPPITGSVTSSVVTGSVSTPNPIIIPSVSSSQASDIVDILSGVIRKPIDPYVIHTDNFYLATELAVNRSKVDTPLEWIWIPEHGRTGKPKLIGFAFKGLLVTWKDFAFRVLVQNK